MKENKTTVFDVRTLLLLDILIMVFMLISGKPEVTLSSFIVAAAVPVITGLYGALVCYAILFAVFFSYYQLIFHLNLPVFHSAVFSVIGILAFIVQRIIPFMLLGTVIKKQKNISEITPMILSTRNKISIAFLLSPPECPYFWGLLPHDKTSDADSHRCRK